MTYLRINTALASIEVPDHRNLLAAWKQYGGPLTLVRSFTVRKPLTPAQLRRLPKDLRARLN
jgi:hypothetical protein